MSLDPRSGPVRDFERDRNMYSWGSIPLRFFWEKNEPSTLFSWGSLFLFSRDDFPVGCITSVLDYGLLFGCRVL
jgi:hypothetical protein